MAEIRRVFISGDPVAHPIKIRTNTGQQIRGIVDVPRPNELHPGKTRGFAAALDTELGDDFREVRLGTEPIYIPGMLDRHPDIGELVRSINFDRILTLAPYIPADIAMTNSRRVIDTNEYTKAVTDRKGGQHREINMPGVERQLAEGATLILNRMDQVDPAALVIARSMEEWLREPNHTHVNSYTNGANAENKGGFGMHWDGQDAFIVQLKGKKHWSVHRPNRGHPIVPDVEYNPEYETVPAWEGVLQASDVLYVPRGWWHRVEGVDEESQHLTVSVKRRRGDNYQSWLADKVKNEEVFRLDLPRFGSRDQIRAHQAELSELLQERMRTSWGIEAYFEESEAITTARRSVSYSWADVERSTSEKYLQTEIVTRTLLQPRVFLHNDTATVLGAGKVLRFDPIAMSVLSRVLEGDGTTIADVLEVAGDRLVDAQVREVLGVLYEHELIGFPM